MNKKAFLKNTLIGALLLTLSYQAMAAFVLSGTRFIYEEGKKSASFEVTNNTKDTYGGQVWVDNTSQDPSDVFMVPSPPVFKVDGGKKQVVRLMNVSPSLPTDRESLFWLNVQELPPKPKEVEGSVLAIAMNTRVKLIYRPKALVQERKDAEKQLITARKGSTLWLKNPTPFYFAVTGIKVNGIKADIPKEKLSGLTTLAPFSEVDTGLPVSGTNLSVQSINDWGGLQDYGIK